MHKKKESLAAGKQSAVKKIVDESKELEPEPLQMDVIVKDTKVRLQFSQPTKWLELQPEQAMGMAQALAHCAKLVSQKKLIIVPGKG